MSRMYSSNGSTKKGTGMSEVNDGEKLARCSSEVESYERSFNHTVIILYSSFKAFN